MGVIIHIENLINELDSIRNTDNIGLITGCFDLLHPGHIDLFRFAKSKVDVLIVGVDTDLSIQKTKGITRPIQSQLVRACILSELRSIDYVLLLDNQHEFQSELSSKYY